MPRDYTAKKDVEGYEKQRGAAKQALYPLVSEWGNPDYGDIVNPCMSKVVHRRQTQGTETSKYLQVREIKQEIAKVAASEMARA